MALNYLEQGRIARALLLLRHYPPGDGTAAIPTHTVLSLLAPFFEREAVSEQQAPDTSETTLLAFLEALVQRDLLSRFPPRMGRVSECLVLTKRGDALSQTCEDDMLDVALDLQEQLALSTSTVGAVSSTQQLPQSATSHLAPSATQLDASVDESSRETSHATDSSDERSSVPDPTRDGGLLPQQSSTTPASGPVAPRRSTIPKEVPVSHQAGSAPAVPRVTPQPAPSELPTPPLSPESERTERDPFARTAPMGAALVAIASVMDQLNRCTGAAAVTAVRATIATLTGVSFETIKTSAAGLLIGKLVRSKFLVSHRTKKRVVDSFEITVDGWKLLADIAPELRPPSHPAATPKRFNVERKPADDRALVALTPVFERRSTAARTVVVKRIKELCAQPEGEGVSTHNAMFRLTHLGWLQATYREGSKKSVLSYTITDEGRAVLAQLREQLPPPVLGATQTPVKVVPRRAMSKNPQRVRQRDHHTTLFLRAMHPAPTEPLRSQYDEATVRGAVRASLAERKRCLPHDVSDNAIGKGLPWVTRSGVMSVAGEDDARTFSFTELGKSELVRLKLLSATPEKNPLLTNEGAPVPTEPVRATTSQETELPVPLQILRLSADPALYEAVMIQRELQGLGIMIAELEAELRRMSDRRAALLRSVATVESKNAASAGFRERVAQIVALLA